MTGTILDKILEAKRVELARHKRETPLAELESRVREAPFPLNLSGALWGDRVRLIAEVKKASPSKGLLAADYDPAARASTYAANGAAAISVLTEADHFQGSLEHLAAVKAVVGPEGVPVLRKDFLFDSYQLLEGACQRRRRRAPHRRCALAGSAAGAAGRGAAHLVAVSGGGPR